MDNIKTYTGYLFEGQREQRKIDELLDISTTRRLTDEEKDLLRRLSSGESLPAESPKKDDGKNAEFFTEKGKKNSAEDTEKKLADKPVVNYEARVYRNKTSEERFIFVHRPDNNTWIVYRTGNPDRTPLGIFLNTTSTRYIEMYFGKTPQALWKMNDMDFDYGMILDQETYNLFIEFTGLAKDTDKNRAKLIQIRQRFLTLI